MVRQPVRLAVINHLPINLPHGGNDRLVEPHSLRMTTHGNILLRAIRATVGQSRSHRVEGIQSVMVTNRPFTPRQAIEFPAEGSSAAPPCHGRRASGVR